MQNFFGIIIEESLEDKSVLDLIKIISTKVEPINEKHQTPWLKQWTLHTVEVEADQAEKVAVAISKAIGKNYWYADYKNDDTHFYIFKDKVFKVNRTSEDEYKQAQDYGLSLGIPDYQVNFLRNLKK
jgi:hypothetical protein